MKRRHTTSQQEILTALKSAPSALSHDMLQTEITSTMDRATIYRILNRFCDDGIVHRIIGDDGKQYFALCLNCEKENHKHRHFHFRCKTCGTVECLAGEVTVSLPKGYIAKNFNGFISGYCGKCDL